MTEPTFADRVVMPIVDVVINIIVFWLTVLVFASPALLVWWLVR